MSVIRGRLPRCLSRIESYIYALEYGISVLPDLKERSITLPHMVNWGNVGLRKCVVVVIDWASRSGLRTASTLPTRKLRRGNEA